MECVHQSGLISAGGFNDDVDLIARSRRRAAPPVLRIACAAGPKQRKMKKKGSKRPKNSKNLINMKKILDSWPLSCAKRSRNKKRRGS